MSVFRLLAEPDRYVACDWDLTADAAGRAYWVRHFREHFDTVQRLIVRQYHPADAQMDSFRRDYLALIDRMADHPEQFGRATIFTLDTERDKVLRRYGFSDPYQQVKAKENAAALAIYPRLIAELDERADEPRLEELIQGVFAGNIFDLGAMATLKRYHAEGLDFFATRLSLAPRPWLMDDLDKLRARWSKSGWAYRKALFLVDNAGCDFVLGCLPLIREFACRRPGPRRSGTAREPHPGCRVVIACNDGPSLNDILVDEARGVLEAARRLDPLLESALSAGRVSVIGSGNAAPLIDLAQVSDELNEAAADADLLVIEGMGRAVESNLHARFTVDTAKLALLKDAEVARRIGGELFDVVCKFEPAA